MDHFQARRTHSGRAVLLVFVLMLSVLAAPSATSAQNQGEPDGWVTRTDGVEERVTSQSNPLVDAEVWDIEFIGNTAYVAGKFLKVTRATSDWSRVDQPFLAAFDGSSGEWVSEFRPQLDGPVWALEIGSNGDLVAGGEFTTVNGQTRTGLVSLDPTTGATNAGFTGLVERRYSEKLAVVRDVHREGDDLYVIGNFSHAIGGNTTMQAGKVARFHATTGTPDTGWTPSLSGRSGWAIDVSDDGNRVFLGGEFTYINGTVGTSLFGAVDAATGALVPGFDHGFNAPPRFVWPLGGIIYDLAVAGNRVYLSGAEHFWESRSDTTGASIQMVLQYDGNWFNDTQVTELEGDTIYIGCHCIRHWGYANHDIVAATGEITGSLTDWVLGGEGVWAVDTAPDGCVWMGGDLRGTSRLRGVAEDGSYRWVGRFARFCSPDLVEVPNDLLGEAATWQVSAEAEWPQGWVAPSFDDNAWQTATTEFGYGDGDEATIVADINRPAAVLGRAQFTVDDPAVYTHLELRLQADDGATVWINGVPVVAHNVAEGVLSAQTLAETTIWGGAEKEWHQYLVPAASLVAGTNTVAVSVHQAWPSSRDLGFDLTLAGSQDGGQPLEPTPQISLAEPVDETTILRPYDGPSRHLDADGPAPADWTTSGFDDQAWAAGSGVLGMAEPDINTELTAGRITYYIRADFEVDAEAANSDATIHLQRDDGAVVYINGQEVGRDNMPDGAVDADTRALTYIWGRAETTPVTFTVPAALLQQGTNVIAVEVHQTHPDSRDLRAAFEIRSNR